MPDTSTDRAAPLLFETNEQVVRLILNRPEKRNALSRELLDELQRALTNIANDPTTRVVVLGANGPVFSAGHDLSEMIGRTEDEFRDLFKACSQVMQAIRRLPQPVIARVHDLATAAGCQLAAACDLVVAADEARFETPGVKVGLFCSTPMVPLVRAIPAKAAMEMLLTGEPISAQRAWQLGLVSRVVARDELDDAVQQYIDAILQSSPTVVRLGKAAFYDGLELDESAAYSSAVETITQNALLNDAQEGFHAFLEKRKPRWSGS